MFTDRNSRNTLNTQIELDEQAVPHIVRKN